MKRQTVENGIWFDLEKAEKFEDCTNRSDLRQTHQDLYHTRKGK